MPILMAFSIGKIFQRFRYKNPLKIIFEIYFLSSRADVSNFSLFHWNNLSYSRASVIPFDFSLADLKKTVGHRNKSVFPLEQFFEIYYGCVKSLENLAIGKRYKVTNVQNLVVLQSLELPIRRCQVRTSLSTSSEIKFCFFKNKLRPQRIMFLNLL